MYYFVNQKNLRFLQVGGKPTLYFCFLGIDKKFICILY